MFVTGHQIIGHDPSVLSQVKGILPIPFLLFHKAGVTRELHSFIISHANAGLTISEIQALWLQTMYDAYGSRREAYLSAWNKNSNICPPFPEFDQRFKQPGEKIIASCIARNYFEKEHLYTKRMCQMTARKWLSCDHTFKVSANIGFWFNKRWVKLYDTLFIVLNEEGNVLGWKLCKGTKFSSVENVLQLLKDRLVKQGEKPTIFFLDNCCSWRSKLLKIFPDVTIKLDPFHAIQRVIRKIPKKKGCTETIMQLRRKMILSLRQLFRDPKDRGEQRTMDTPSPEVILENIEMFMRQWSTAEIDSIPLLSSSAIKEINNLKHHVIKGFGGIMAVGRVKAAPSNFLLICLCLLFLLLRNQYIRTAKLHDYIECTVSLGSLRENPQRNGHVFFSPSSCVRHLRNLASVTGRTKKRVFAHSRIPYYSNHSAVFNIELICSHGDIHPHRAAQFIGTTMATWLMEIDTADLIYLSSMLTQEA